MNEREHDRLDESQRLAREAVRSLPRPEADAAFRARLKEQFVSGAIDASPPSAAPGSRLGSVWLGWSALAAAAVVTVALLGFNRLPGPELASASGSGTVVVDGREIAVSRTEVLDEVLRVGARVQVGEDTEIDVVYPGTMILRLSAGTDLVLPERPGRWFQRTVEAPMVAGEMSLRTGPDLVGGGVIVRTDEGRAVIRGTLVSVVRTDDVTCICLFDGDASVTCSSGDLGALEPGKRWVLFRDGSEPAFADIEPAHREHMRGLDIAHPAAFDDR